MNLTIKRINLFGTLLSSAALVSMLGATIFINSTVAQESFSTKQVRESYYTHNELQQKHHRNRRRRHRYRRHRHHGHRHHRDDRYYWDWEWKHDWEHKRWRHRNHDRHHERRERHSHQNSHRR